MTLAEVEAALGLPETKANLGQKVLYMLTVAAVK
jgi:hypothetical protein